MRKLVATCLFLSIALHQSHAEGTALDSLKQKYDTEVQRIRNEHETELERLLDAYGSSLDTATATLRRGGDPDPVLKAISEKTRFEKERTVPKKPTSGLSPRIQKVRNSYHDAVKKAGEEQDKSAAETTRKYIAALDRLMRHYTNEDELDLAMNVKAEKKRAEFILADMESGAPKAFPRAPSSAPRPGQNLSVDLGAGVKMEFVWIQALKMWVGKYEVTNGQYRRMAPAHDSKKYKGHSLNGDRQPVVYVSFDDARKYAAWLTQKLRSAGALLNGYSFRLPTEKEWMTFAQCGDNRKYPWGDSWPPRTGKAGNYSGEETTISERGTIKGYDDSHVVTCKVESCRANPWNLYGVGGNVLECCAQDDDVSSYGAWLGSCWVDCQEANMRCLKRCVSSTSHRAKGKGFRLVLSR